MSARFVTIVLLGSILLTGCAAPSDTVNGGTVSQPTLTLGENGCTYSGPSELGTTFTLTWIVEDIGSSGYIYSVATLDEGKTIDDITSMPAENLMPEWFNSIRIDFSPGPGVFAKWIDLKANSLFEGGPIYFVCFLSDEDLALGAAGPFKVER